MFFIIVFKLGVFFGKKKKKEKEKGKKKPIKERGKERAWISCGPSGGVSDLCLGED